MQIQSPENIFYYLVILLIALSSMSLKTVLAMLILKAVVYPERLISGFLKLGLCVRNCSYGI